jgi:metal-responsive CopG/Arc/MetJ family transcriptional regulator
MKAIIGITIDERLLATIDTERSTPNGSVSRSAFIESIIKDHLEAPKVCEGRCKK